jgi:GNAT superfamily N-acetyltransferase
MVQIDPYTDTDADAVAALCTAVLDLDTDGVEAPAMLARLAAPPPGRDPLRLVARDGGEPVGVLVAASADGFGYVELLAVAGSARRRGLGRGLLGAAEEVLRARGATQVRLAGFPPCYVWPGIDVRYTAAVCLAESAGYERGPTAWNMTVDLTTADLATGVDEARLAAGGVVVRRGEPAEAGRVGRWAGETFGGGWAWEVAQSLRDDGTAGCHVAERDGELLGFAAWGANRPSWFGPMGTAAAARGCGIGAVLLRRCLADPRGRGLDRAQIGWVGPLRFYSLAVGARVERVFWQYTKPL